MTEDYATQAIQSILTGEKAFCKFLSANDTGVTGGHQAGIYISKPSVSILFDTPGEKGSNKGRWVKIKWQNELVTDTRFIYYGQGTRNEYRITNFGRGFPFLRPEYTGALFVLVQNDSEDYQGFFLNSEDEINQFLDAFGISPTETNCLIETTQTLPEVREKTEIDRFIDSLDVDFPDSAAMSYAAREIQNRLYNHIEYARTNPDAKLLDWTDMEFKLFRALEHARYTSILKKGFPSMDSFLNTANMVLNRRKSRAGKSLEHHLSAIFNENNLQYDTQAKTEGNKRPDFIFPSRDAYHNLTFPVNRLITLAAKTTCKDRWRQVINEANRLRDKPKYLCTLQQGISPAQMDEMQAENVVLVVPAPYISSYPKDHWDKIWSLAKFIKYVQETEKSHNPV